MSVRSSLRAIPTMTRVGLAEAIAYRAEMLVWVLATTMPLIMLALWTAVARDAPIGRFGQAQFTAYFLATFIVRQMTGSWVSWQLSYEVRQGILAMRLLRPVSPLLGYAIENIASLPMRLVIAVPVALIMLLAVGAHLLPHAAAIWGLWAVSMAGGWAITFVANVCIGCLALYVGSSVKVMDIYLALYFVFSGYLIPIELFPKALRTVTAWMPFRYQIGLPVELMTGAYSVAAGLQMVLRQWLWVAALAALAAIIWRTGIKRFAAYGG